MDCKLCQNSLKSGGLDQISASFVYQDEKIAFLFLDSANLDTVVYKYKALE
jgi:hypothetical protein